MYPNPAKCFFFPHQRLQVPKPKNEICFLQEEIHVSVPPLVKLVPTKVCVHFSVQVLEKKNKKSPILHLMKVLGTVSYMQSFLFGSF